MDKNVLLEGYSEGRDLSHMRFNQLQAYYTLTTSMAESIYSKYSIEMSQKGYEMMDYLKKIYGVRLNADNLRRLYQDYVINHMSTLDDISNVEAEDGSRYSYQEVRTDYIYNFPERADYMIQYLKSFAGGNKNGLLNSLAVTFSRRYMNRIIRVIGQSNMSIYSKSGVSSGWVDLLNFKVDDEIAEAVAKGLGISKEKLIKQVKDEAYNFAKQLYVYNYFVGGMGFNTLSFSHFATAAVKSAIDGFDARMRSLRDEMSSEESSNLTSDDIVFLNNFVLNRAEKLKGMNKLTYNGIRNLNGERSGEYNELLTVKVVDSNGIATKLIRDIVRSTDEERRILSWENKQVILVSNSWKSGDEVMVLVDADNGVNERSYRTYQRVRTIGNEIVYPIYYKGMDSYNISNNDFNLWEGMTSLSMFSGVKDLKNLDLGLMPKGKQ